MIFTYFCHGDDAHRLCEWAATRGGIALWKSVDLGDLGASWASPLRRTDGTETTSPHWKCGPDAKPDKVITDPAQVGVFMPEVFEEVPVCLHQRGLQTVITDSSQKKLDKVLARCKAAHGDFFYYTGGMEPSAIAVCYTKEVIPLDVWVHRYPTKQEWLTWVSGQQRIKS